MLHAGDVMLISYPYTRRKCNIKQTAVELYIFLLLYISIFSYFLFLISYYDKFDQKRPKLEEKEGFRRPKYTQIKAELLI